MALCPYIVPEWLQQFPFCPSQTTHCCNTVWSHAHLSHKHTHLTHMQHPHSAHIHTTHAPHTSHTLHIQTHPYFAHTGHTCTSHTRTHIPHTHTLASPPRSTYCPSVNHRICLCCSWWRQHTSETVWPHAHLTHNCTSHMHVAQCGHMPTSLIGDISGPKWDWAQNEARIIWTVCSGHSGRLCSGQSRHRHHPFLPLYLRIWWLHTLFLK